MNISEVIQVLQDRKAKHGDVEVRVTWEGQEDIDLEADYIWLGSNNILYLDADCNFYKEAMLHPSLLD